MERRRYLRCIVAAGGAASLAGCADDGTGGEDPTETDDGGDMGTPTEGDMETPTEGDMETPTETEAETATETAEPTETPPADPDQRVMVGDGLNFDPEAFEISVGDTVLWEWVGSGHNIAYDEGDVPDGTGWEGDSGDLYSEGHTHFHTFETAGEYGYYCQPHQSSGMVGNFTVSE